MAENGALSFPRTADQNGQTQQRGSVFGGIGDAMGSAWGKVTKFFSGAEDDEAPVLVDDIDDSDLLRNNPVKGFGYNISYCHYQDLSAHPKSFFWTSPLGDPFPSYHNNPMPDFHARWTLIPNIKMPCESITAPRIRLGPTELKVRQKVLAKMRLASSRESQTPTPNVLNLSHQTLGDPYQYEAFITFWEINKTAQVLSLVDNELDDILDLDLTNVKKMYLSRNNFSTFHNIPEMPNCEELHINQNFITSTKGLTSSKYPKLRKLSMLANPAEELGMKELEEDIRSALPDLEWFNDVPVGGWPKPQKTTMEFGSPGKLKFHDEEEKRKKEEEELRKQEESQKSASALLGETEEER